MAIIQIETNDSLWQSSTMILPTARGTLRVNFELRYLPKTDLWYMSMTDVQSGECYFRYVPVLASTLDEPNNLIEPFWHDGIGMIICVPVVENPSSENPSEKNLNEFALIWGDGDEN